MAGTSPQPNVTAHGRAFMYPPRFWVLVLLSGAGAGVAGGLLMRLLGIIEHLAYSYSSGDYLQAVARVSPQHRIVMLLGAGVVAGVAAYLLPRLLRSRPVDLTKAVWFRSGRLPLVYTVLKGTVSIVIVGMGVSLGREGALKDTGGAIASKLSDWFSLPAGQRRVLVACAAGAGMAAAYNMPLGGALFAAEILLGTLSFSMLLPALATSTIATAASWIFLRNQAAYATPVYLLHRWDLVWALLAAPIFGLASVLWVRVVGWAERNRPSGWHKIVTPVIIFGLVGVIAISFPDVLGNGKDLVQRTFSDGLNLRLLFSMLVLRVIVTAGCLRTGAPGGVFTPTMTFGALLGGLFGRLWALMVPETEVGAFAAIGSAAVLAVTTQGPISSIVMVMELTHHVDAILVPLLLATVGASLTAHWLEPRSVYSADVDGGADALALPTETLSGPYVSKEYVLVSSAAPYAAVVTRMLAAGTHGFVLDEANHLVGAISLTFLREQPPQTPLNGTTAADMAEEVTPLTSVSDAAEIERRLREACGLPVPVVDRTSRRFMGARRSDTSSL